MTNKEKVELLKANFCNENGCIDLSGLNLGANDINLSGIETEGIIVNESQKANHIYNSLQCADTINNKSQKAKDYIYNREQEAIIIDDRNKESNRTIC